VIAALYVEPDGAYYGLEGVDPWDEARDARKYAGPHPVVAHPPCARWSKLAGFCEAVHGLKRGDDKGCFAAALASVRRWGGVLEHPASSAAWSAHGLDKPHRSGGWSRGLGGGWSCHVEQGRYGHPARKASWLYAVGIDLPDMRWGPAKGCARTVGGPWRRASTTPVLTRPRRVVGGTASATPEAFRDALIAMARSVTRD